MASRYARIYVDIWADDDFRRLTLEAQHLYFLLVTFPSLGKAGVTDWRPARLSVFAAGLTTQGVWAAGRELANAGFVVIDADTEEVLVRSYMRHDGILKSPNITKAMLADYGSTASPLIRDVIAHEVWKARRDHPDMAGLRVIGDAITGCGRAWSDVVENQNERVREQFPEGFGFSSVNRFDSVSNQFDSSSRKGSELVPETVPTSYKPINHKPINHPPRARTRETAPGFDRFWEAYPRKERRADALAQWDQATTETPPETIIAGAERLAADPNLPELRYVPMPANWLRNRSWQDGPLPPRKPTSGGASQTELRKAMRARAEARDAANNSLTLIAGGEPND